MSERYDGAGELGGDVGRGIHRLRQHRRVDATHVQVELEVGHRERPVDRRLRRHPDAAALVLRTVLSQASQRGTYASSGGQPGRRSAWTDPHLNALCPDFFAATLTTLHHAFVRARVTGYPSFQELAGPVLHRGVRAGDDPAAIIDDLSRRWRDAIT